MAAFGANGLLVILWTSQRRNCNPWLTRRIYPMTRKEFLTFLAIGFLLGTVCVIIVKALGISPPLLIQ